MDADEFVRSMAIESWTLYSFGLFLIACRTASRRIKLGGWRHLQIEDWLMGLVTITFTAFTVSVNETAKNGSNYMAPEVAEALTPEGVARAIYGSKMTLALEMMTLTTVWLVKACLLFLYYRLTEAFYKQRLAVKLIAAYCGVSYILVVVMCLSYWCSPIYEYWSVPVKHSQCATYYNHMIFATSFNISSDLMLLLIPIPLIIRTHLPLKRKLVLCSVLGLGVFNIVAAILNRYYNFNNPNDLGYMYWYVGEVAVAVYVGNVPLCWPLFRTAFHASSWFDSKDNTTPKPQQSKESSRFGRRHPTGHSSLWLSARSHTTWDMMDDTEEHNQKIGHLENSMQESQGSDIELTPAWHYDANTTVVNADIATDSTGRDDTGDFDKVTVVKTVNVSRD